MVLFVDDHYDNCRPFAVYLERAGIDVEWVPDGPAAVEFVKTRTPALIVMDEMMPGMSGRDTVRQLRTRPEMRHTPVIFFTGSDMQPADVDDLGVTRVFYKASSDVAEVCETMVEAHDEGLEQMSDGGGAATGD